MEKQSLAPQRGFFPQPVYLIGTWKKDGAPNFALVTWITFCSVDPPMLMFASRGTKLTRELVKKNRVFSANLVTTPMLHMADYFGTHSGYNSDKCREIQAAFVRGALLDVPVLESSPWVYECELTDMRESGDGCIYIGTVRNILADRALNDTAYTKIDMGVLDPLIYVPGRYYRLSGEIGEVGCSQIRP